MTKNAMLEFLIDQYKKVIDWVKYAETKNAALVALNGAFLFGVLNIIISEKLQNYWANIYAYLLIILFLTSLVISLISFIPRLNAPWLKINEQKGDNDNIIYFGHIAKYTPSQYLRLIDEKLDLSDYSTSEASIYSNQIVINSQVTLIKLKQFEIAAWFFLAALISPIGVLIMQKIKT